MDELKESNKEKRRVKRAGTTMDGLLPHSVWLSSLFLFAIERSSSSESLTQAIIDK